MPNEEKRLERIEALVCLLQDEIATWRKEQAGAATSGPAPRKGLTEIEIAKLRAKRKATIMRSIERIKNAKSNK